MTRGLDEQRLRRLLEVGATLSEDLELDAILHGVLTAARELTGARYAALGVLDEAGQELDRFLTQGIDEETRLHIGDLPRRRGVLGVLIDEPRPLRLRDVSADPRAYGFPPGHPPMRSFLGVPIMIRGEPFGNLYLTEKDRGDFDESDEGAVVMLADYAAVAVNNARLSASAEHRRGELERAVAGLEATVDISRAVGLETDLPRVLELIVKRARALVEARALIILLREGDELVVAATAGELKPGQRGARFALEGTVAHEVVRTRSAMRVSDVAREMSELTHKLGLDAATGLVAPLTFRGLVLGVIQAYDRMVDGPVFSPRDEMLLQSFAASAAVAVATAQSVERGRLEQSVNAAEQERRRWARELHDETLQSLGAVRLMLSGALRSGELENAVPGAVEQLQHAIDALRALISELRPATLDELGLGAAVESLVERLTAELAAEADLSVDLDYEAGRAATRLAPELESAAYRIVQEALNNAIRHAGARSLAVELSDRTGELRVVVRDDGCGFDLSAPGGGFGLLGMRERVDLVGGSLTVDSVTGEGTTVAATFAVRRAEATVRPAPARGRA